MRNFWRCHNQFVNNRDGWILLDSLLAMLILTIALLAIALAHTYTTKTSTFSDRTAQATYIAQQELEKLKRDYDATYTQPDVNKCSPSNGMFTIKCNIVTGVAPFSDLTLVPVSATVSWSDPNPNSVTVITYYFYRTTNLEN